MSKFTDRLQHAWNAFMNKDPTMYPSIGAGTSLRPDRVRLTGGNESSIVNSVYTRIAMDVMSTNFKHVRVDPDGRFVEELKTGLNKCLTLEANKDQTARALVQDLVMSMFDEGVVALMPVDTDINPEVHSTDILSLRTAKIVEWYPDNVKLDVYNDITGQRQQIIMAKKAVCINENPLYSIINERNSTMQRLVRKLNLLDVIDEQSGSGKLDLLIQLPYSLRNEIKRADAERRRKEIESQLADSKYGVAYIDATEHVTQLNRSVENNLLSQIEYLTSMLYSQLGITQSILDGTADEKTYLNYYRRTIEPIVTAICDEMNRKFISTTARTQGQRIMAFRDPFSFVTVSELAEAADKLTRNEIMTSNEVRQIIGLKPVDSPEADELRNKNLNAGTDEQFATVEGDEVVNKEDELLFDKNNV